MEVVYNDFKLWEEIVTNNKDLEIYYFPNYNKIFELNGDGKLQIAIVHIDNDNFLLAPFFIREIPETNYNDISTPYGYGGPFVKGKISLKEFYRVFTKYCLNNKIVTSFVRFNLFSNSEKEYLGDVTSNNDILLVDTNKNIDVLFGEYHRSVRKSIRAAKRNEIEVVSDSSFKHLNEFYDIYIETMKNSNAKEYYFFDMVFFENILKYIGSNAILFHSIYDNKIVASELVLYSKHYAYSFLGGSLKEFLHLRTNNILKHEIFNWCNLNDIGTFVLGGGYKKNDGIFKYKQTFTQSEPIKYYIGKQIIDEEVYKSICDTFIKKKKISSETLEGIDFFPLYRYLQNL